MGTKRGKYASGVKRREEILLAAYNQIAEGGHHSVTMKSVADAIDVTEPALYYHFPTRDELLVEVLRYRDRLSIEREVREHPGYEAMIQSMRLAQQTPWFMALFSEFAARATDETHPAHSFFVERYEFLRSLSVEAFEAWVGPGQEVDHTEAERIMLEIAATADGLQTRWLVTRDFDIADHIQAVIERLAPRAARALATTQG